MFRRLVTGGATALLTAGTALLAGGAQAQAAEDAPAGAGGDRTTVVAHRGASAYAPENTLAAVRAADRLGIDWVENDVQRTKDGKLVIVHDTTLTRTTDVEERFPDRAPWNVRDFTLAEIRTLDAGSWKGAAFAGEKVPTLKEYLDQLDRTGQNLLMEIKAPELYPGIEQQVVQVLGREGWLDRWHVKHKLVMQSFSAESVKTFHGLQPLVKTGFLGTPAIADLPEYARFADQINPRYTTVTADYVDAVHAVRGVHGKPLEVFTWTVNDGEQARTLAETGVDGIITDVPDVVHEAVNGPRGAAPADATAADPADLADVADSADSAVVASADGR
ncbi:hydrolase [Streptomyces capparidis]